MKPEQTHYYLINGEIKKGIAYPKLENEMKDQKSFIEHWLNSLQPCSITDVELEKVKCYLCSDAMKTAYINVKQFIETRNNK